MTTLRVILDPMVAPEPGGSARYTEELTRKLIELAPPGCDVAGIVSRSGATHSDTIDTLLPGLGELITVPLSRPLLARAWRSGMTALPLRAATERRSSTGMTHATTPVAPLSSHDRSIEPGNQTVITIHDTAPWTHPGALAPGRASLYKDMVKRAHRHADAVITPTHAVAEALSEYYDFGDRIRVIGGAVSSKLQLPVDPDERAARLDLPERYILTVGTLEPRKRLSALIQSLAHPDSVELPLLIAGPAGWGGIDVAAIAAEAGLAPDRVRALGFLPDADLAVLLDRATVFAYPSTTEGFGLSILEAFSLGTPVVHSTAPALIEVGAGAGLAIDGEADGYPERLAQAIASIADDNEKAQRMRYLGLDRANAFSWADSARKVWQVHAEL